MYRGKRPKTRLLGNFFPQDSPGHLGAIEPRAAPRNPFSVTSCYNSFDAISLGSDNDDDIDSGSGHGSSSNSSSDSNRTLSDFDADEPVYKPRVGRFSPNKSLSCFTGGEVRPFFGRPPSMV